VALAYFLFQFSGDQLKTIPGLKYIVSMDPLPDGKTIEGVKLMTWQDLLRLGAEKQIKFDEPKPDELCTICYTSGTTGDPKGVMLTHKNFVAVMSAMAIVTEISTADVHVSYLPLAHMYERAVLETVMCCGGQVGFFSGDILKLLDDIAVLKPTVFASVPRLYNRMYDRIKATVASSSDFAKGMFETAFNSKLQTLKSGGGVSSFLWDSVVFSKTKARLGGRVRFMGSGAAPLQAEVQDFLKVTMCAPVLQGYGMTETCGITHVQDKSDFASGAVGGILPCSEFKLVDVPEMNYFATDEPPRGEICVRGANVFQGYFKMPDKTEECLEKDGWLHTGDIGVVNANGTLSIIDRKKNIFKLSQGEYVAAEKIENAYSTHPWIQQIWVYGDSTQSVLVAVVVPDADKIKAWASANGHSGGEDVAAILADPKVKEMIYSDLTKHGKEQKLRGFEFVKNILLEHTPFSIENDLITPTFKLKRPQLKAKYQQQLDAMYSELASKPADEDRAPAKTASSSSK
jgi:long-chain acyl-CoA synthetase